MKNVFRLTFLSFFAVSCISHKNVSGTNITNKAIHQSISNHEDNWIYFNLKEPTELKVISHRFNDTMCGYFATASMTIGVTKENDTIRVFELCDVSKIFAANEYVIVIPKERPDFRVNYPGVYEDESFIPHPDDLQVINTTYGIIERKK